MSKMLLLYLQNLKGKMVLESIVDNFDKNIIFGVITSKNSSVKDDYYKDICYICSKNNIPLLDLKSDLSKFLGLRIAVGWRKMIHEMNNLIIFHDSLLPKYRGFSPLPNMLINKEKYIGVTSLYAKKDYDSGDIIFQYKTKVKYPITINDAILIIGTLYQKMIIKIIKTLINKKELPRTHQNELKSTYSVWRDEDDYFIDWNQSAVDIKRFVDSVGYPYEGAKTYLRKKVIFIKNVEIISIKIEVLHIGKVVKIKDGYPIVICKKNALIILEALDEDGNSIVPFSKIRTRFGKYDSF